MTIRTVYVDPLNGSASPTDPTDPGDAYNTAQNATVGEAADLVSTTITLVIKGVDTATDTGALYVNGYTTDATYFITYTYQDGAKSDGIAGGSGYLINPPNQIRIREDYTEFIGIGIDVSNATANPSIWHIAPSAFSCARDCLIIDRSSVVSTIDAIATGKMLLENCVLVEVGIIRDVNLYNCARYTSKAVGLGFRDCECYNVIAHVPNETSGVFLICTGDYNSGTDTTAPGANSRDNQTLSNIDFVSTTSTSEDLHIQSTSDMRDQGIGTTQSGVPSTDFDGDARGVATCDIGVDEFTSGGLLPIEITAGAMTLTGKNVNVNAAEVISIGKGAFTLTGQSVTTGQFVTINKGVFTLIGKSVTLDELITITPGIFTLTGKSVNLTIGEIIEVSKGIFTITGQDTFLNETVIIENASITITGKNVTILGERANSRGLSKLGVHMTMN